MARFNRALFVALVLAALSLQAAAQVTDGPAPPPVAGADGPYIAISPPAPISDPPTSSPTIPAASPGPSSDVSPPGTPVPPTSEGPIPNIYPPEGPSGVPGAPAPGPDDQESAGTRQVWSGVAMVSLLAGPLVFC